MSDVGIDDDVIKQVRENVTPGTSALLVMTSNVVADKVLYHFKETGATQISTNLSTEQEAKLRERSPRQSEARDRRVKDRWAARNTTGGHPVPRHGRVGTRHAAHDRPRRAVVEEPLIGAAAPVGEETGLRSSRAATGSTAGQRRRGGAEVRSVLHILV